MHFNVQVQGDGDFQAAVLLFGLSVLVQISSRLEHDANLLGRQGLQLIVA